jgi:hypothetical protein
MKMIVGGEGTTFKNLMLAFAMLKEPARPAQ